ncbi:PepSY domain-containing protein [Chitinophaga rhizophila]|uniref:PepSY domain-containing protein n=1 Tax=Chitinophaga rhizophila TaxID=2866212 RepID=A0ABS7G9Y5_9BACT|nr:PepSY domain-containing protein [Chitinophaga rhizophila]MBW8684477.1 PepSY domain-containing protein [Chitinophaga rhizophila]
MKKLKKGVMLLHRYLGFVLSLLFVCWFLSGFVMMYASYPTMKYHQRLQQLPAVRLGACRLTPQQAMVTAGITDTVRSMRIGMLLDRPVYRMITQKNQHLTVFADSGTVLREVDTALAAKVATAFVNNSSRPQRIETLSQIDQWMAAHRSQGYLPQVHRCEMDDAAGTYVYVSVYTGEAVQKLNGRQRFWAWLGPVPHWIYPTVLIRNRQVWSQVVIWVSLIGCVMCLSGIIMGIIRYKRKRGNGLDFSPYKKRWFRYHHYTGFVFGLFVFTWVLSGLFSMGPLAIGPDSARQLAERNVLSGAWVDVAGYQLSPAQAMERLGKTVTVKELQMISILGRPYYLAYEDGMHTCLLAADETDTQPFRYYPVAPLLAAVKGFQQNYSVRSAEVLERYDDYYYARAFDKRLPVLRVSFDNPEKTSYYIDLATGQLALKHEKGSRVERWLYHGLHSFDFSFLVYKRPLWDIVVLVLLTGGTLVSITGLVLTWKWCRRKVNS